MRTLVHGSFPSLLLAVVAVLLITTAGFCIYDTDGHDHDGLGFDLCTAILAVTFGPLVVATLGAGGHTAARLGWAATPVSISILDPPPRHSPSA